MIDGRGWVGLMTSSLIDTSRSYVGMKISQKGKGRLKVTAVVASSPARLLLRKDGNSSRVARSHLKPDRRISFYLYHTPPIYAYPYHQRHLQHTNHRYLFDHRKRQ
jgi:hypothetical protein